jgi:hypothetical protein
MEGVMTKRFKGIILLIIVALLTVAFGGCRMHIDWGQFNAVIGNGKMETKTVSVEQEVTGVRNMGSIDVVIDPSLDGEAIIEGESNVIDLVELDQNGKGEITVSLQDHTSFTLHRPLTVTIPAVNGGLIELDGSGNISLDSKDALKADAFSVRIMGSGDISLMLDADELEADISGSGDIDLNVNTKQMRAHIDGSGRIRAEGTADDTRISINGSGDFDGRDCAMQKADISISGSGDISVDVASELTGSVNGSGDVIYTGDPETVSISDNGSGDVIKR